MRKGASGGILMCWDKGPWRSVRPVLQDGKGGFMG
ncbi:hypothetical protein CK203_085359 [Vitis vinifera]|uniref:Uncharacterized protein n=1 Tax=Vitis vinifera TaxID=29760 RepID=A0A438DCX4_VITVI|nr:hypothetical protein CK203_085359 [Vitis vinifera]